MNSNLKIKILYDFQDGPWGGGNQFFQALRNEFRKLGIYEEELAKANCILFYSYQKLEEVIALKKKYPEKFFIHRLGEVFYYHRQGGWKIIDRATVIAANNLADGVVFNSKWLHQELAYLGFRNKNYAIIGNCLDETFFNNDRKKPPQGEKIKLIASSWSDNPNKGYTYYQYLDQQLDWSKYEMTFVGNSPIIFRNIKMLPPLPSVLLAKELKKHDIYITATKNDACSNAILEALACGLPVVALDSGGNREVIRNAGELFTDNQNMIRTIEAVVKNYQSYVNKIEFKGAGEIASEYIEQIEQWLKNKPYRFKAISAHKIQIYIFFFRQRQRYNQVIKKITQIKKNSYRYYKASWHRNILEWLLHANINLLKGKVLDIGSKNRRYDKMMKGAEVTAVDIEENKELNVLYGDIEVGLDYSDDYFDAILCLEVMEYLQGFDKASKEIYRLLKPGGAAIISIPFLQNDHDDNFRPTKKFAEKIFQEATFTQIAIRTFGNGYTVIWDIVKRKWMCNKSEPARKLIYYFLLWPWLIILKIFRIDKIQDQYYSGLFIILKK
ncbi:methyltransferase domain-containing protein [Candidatus Kuenenbacteria bacterium]|nr:methyltransferase domain-containing protein [Candidatus Kuenenbacteria bacterium]